MWGRDSPVSVPHYLTPVLIDGQFQNHFTMRTLYYLLTSIGLLLGQTFAKACPATGSVSPMVAADTTAPPNNPLKQILDSLRKRPTLKGVNIKLRDINFETNSFVLTAASAAYLDTVAGVLNKIPAVILEIGGHTDNVGTPSSNQILSQSRAQSVRSRLVDVGQVAAKRVTFRGYGESRPVAPNTTESGRSLNRRVEMQFVGLDNEQVAKIYLRNGEVIRAPLIYVNAQNRSVLYKTGENAPLLELPCASVLKILFADNREQIIECPPVPVVRTAAYEVEMAPKRPSKLYLQLHGEAGYMIGENPSWTSKTNGYAHVLGFGGSLTVGYRLTKRISAGVRTGYWQWSTQVNYRAGADGPVLRQYNSKAVQIPLYITFPVYLTNHVYLMPEGGINLLTIDAGFAGESQSDFSGIQTGYGVTLGYTTNRDKRVQADVGLFYRTYQQGNWNEQYGIPVMNCVGLKLGLGFSL